MDKLPKLRRKPKPPAIETSVERTSTDTTESALSSSAVGSWLQKEHTNPSGKKSPFRNLRLRPSAKRARESSPADSGLGEPPATRQDGVKVKSNGAKPRDRLDGKGDADTDMEEPSDPGPVMPSFLNLEKEAIDLKFEDLNWDERIRLSKGQANHPHHEWRWGSFKQTDVKERGLMDRYVNIKPWNHNRVKLRVPDGHLDYVNASLITVRPPPGNARPPLRYIAMQGPTEPSIPYVWRMIAEQVKSPSVIVQLTSNNEGGMVKCNQYFPEGEEGSEWDLNGEDAWEDGWGATLKYESVEQLHGGAIEKRKLSLHVEGEKEPRTIWHFWYRSWPDFGVPADDDLDSFFELMRLSREHSSPNGPRVIHCSAGVGRTGTFIALEHLLRELDVGALYDPPVDGNASSQPSKPDLIYDTVQELREQRKGMVQSDIQYRFLYQVLRKLWSDRYGPAEDDEDKADGGVNLDKPVQATSAPEVDPFWDGDDDDEGGARLRDSAMGS
ncbi:protein-tyrosine phosphatase 2 [Emericellopsis atlantica]|uniref:Protein-tyrosine phosphatase 2 n=1 Tax=Emericellopsis atlantica TaxID=2614577 RepID=A0A9P8CKY7_9HYPO|nr:protein-tyrosine phosphatase 2 [Emericellopsis atlantica]KAG9250527.1 protein-tyrosine phosphatase 2 [Emericellopsis atlantica]